MSTGDPKLGVASLVSAATGGEIVLNAGNASGTGWFDAVGSLKADGIDPDTLRDESGDIKFEAGENGKWIIVDYVREVAQIIKLVVKKAEPNFTESTPVIQIKLAMPETGILDELLVEESNKALVDAGCLYRVMFVCWTHEVEENYKKIWEVEHYLNIKLRDVELIDLVKG